MNNMKKTMMAAMEGESQKKKGYMNEENPYMQAINDMKEAVSQIEKKYTQQVSNDETEKMQDGNMGEAAGGTQDYSGLDYDAKTKMLVAKMKKFGV